MTFAAQAQMTDDDGLKKRIAACAGTFGIRDAKTWAENHIWLLVGRPGWGVRYEEATKGDPPSDPAGWSGVHGIKDDIITDEMIRDGVEDLYVAEVVAAQAAEASAAAALDAAAAASAAADAAAASASLSSAAAEAATAPQTPAE